MKHILFYKSIRRKIDRRMDIFIPIYKGDVLYAEYNRKIRYFKKDSRV